MGILFRRAVVVSVVHISAIEQSRNLPVFPDGPCPQAVSSDIGIVVITIAALIRLIGVGCHIDGGNSLRHGNCLRTVDKPRRLGRHRLVFLQPYSCGIIQRKLIILHKVIGVTVKIGLEPFGCIDTRCLHRQRLKQQIV